MADNRETVRQAVEELWNQDKLDQVEKYYADDFVFHTEGGDVQRGPDSIRQWLNTTHGAIPDIN